MSNANGLRYRLLPGGEWDRLKLVFDELDWFLPDKMVASASVAEDGSKLVGIQMLQLVLHAEPTWVHPDYSGRVNYLRMWSQLKDLPKPNNKMLFPGFVLVAPNEKVREMAELAQFQEIPGVLMRKEW